MSRSRIAEVFSDLSETVVIPNVRDAVRGLQGNSSLNGPVQFYGDRSIIIPSSGIAIKEPRTPGEEAKIKNHFAFLLDMGIGAKKIFYANSVGGGTEGIVDRLLAGPSNIFLQGVEGRSLQFFIDTPEAEQLTDNLRLSKIGSPAEICRSVNNKIDQREMLMLVDEEIFPPHFIASSEEEVVECFRKISSLGVALGKIGHLASGEGMEELKDEREAVDFWRKWVPVLRLHKYPEKIIVELKMNLADKHNSTSVQFFVDKNGARYLGSSVQHIGKSGFVHEGNKIGQDIRSQLTETVEEEMIRKSEAMFKFLPPATRGFIGFDYIIGRDGKVLLTEINLRTTASTLMYALAAQIGEHMSFDLRKIHVGPAPKIGLIEFLKRLGEFNNGDRIVVPLNGRLFDETGEMFVTVCARTFGEIEETRDEFLRWF